MKHLKYIKEHWSDNPDNSNDELTVGKLIDILKGYDLDQPVRLRHDGRDNQEIESVTQNKEGFRTDDDEWIEYSVVQINSIN